MIHTEINTIWLLPILVVVFILCYGYYFRGKKNSEQVKRNRVFLFTVRFLVLITLGFLLLNPFFLDIEENKKPSEVVLAVDISTSANQNLDTLLLKNKIDEFNALSKSEVNFSTVYFGSSVSDSIKTSNKKTTNFQSLFHYLENKYPSGILSQVVLLTDGIVNQGSTLASYHQLPFSVHTVKIGDTTKNVDAKIIDVYHNKSTYFKNEFPLVVKAVVEGVDKGSLDILVYFDDSLQQKLTKKITKNSNYINHEFILLANKVGVKNVKVEIKSSFKEKELRNNLSYSTIEVIDTKKKILLLYDRVTPDIAAISSLMKYNQDYDLQKMKLSEVSNTTKVKDFNAIVLFGNPDQKHNIWKLIENSSVGFVQFMDYQFTGRVSNSYYSFQSNNNNSQEAFALFDNQSSVIKLSTEQLYEMPPLQVVSGNFQLKGSPITILKQKIGTIETDRPIIQLTTIGKQKVAVVLGTGFWNWRLQDLNNSLESNSNPDSKVFNTLFKSLINFVATKANQDRLNVVHPLSVVENEQILFVAEILNKSYQIQKEAEVELSISKDDFSRTFIMIPNGNQYKMNVGTLPVGRYQVTVTSKAIKDTLINKSALIVKEQLIEFDNLVANWECLELLSSSTGGISTTLSNFDDILKVLEQKDYKFISYSQEKEQPLISWEILCFILIGLLTIEWLVRKYIGYN